MLYTTVVNSIILDLYVVDTIYLLFSEENSRVLRFRLENFAYLTTVVTSWLIAVIGVQKKNFKYIWFLYKCGYYLPESLGILPRVLYQIGSYPSAEVTIIMKLSVLYLLLRLAVHQLIMKISSMSNALIGFEMLLI